MTSNIQKAFKNGKAFVPFITCGDPTLETTEKVVAALVRAGSDLIELGIPFSDPTAEGPTIQNANFRALRGGATTDKIFATIARIRRNVSIPLAIMTYANVVFSFGIEKFASRCAELGVDGLILPDVPFEEKEEFAGPLRTRGVDLISMVAPTSDERVESIAATATGFLYCVSSLGVTGVRSNFSANLSETILRAKRANPNLPCAVGFGVSTPEQAKRVGALADGVVVGSALVNLCAKYGAAAVPFVENLAREMKNALRDADVQNR